MSAAHLATVVLVGAGTVVVVAASLAALIARGPYGRLHLVGVVTAFGGPLIAIGLVVDNGAGLTAASILLPAGLLFFTGPILAAAISRLAAQRDGRTRSGNPE